MANQSLKFQSILAALHWLPGAIKQHALCNWFYQLGTNTYNLYSALHLHLINLHLKHGWDYAKLAIKHHSKHLMSIRAQAPGCLTCLVRLYIYLRDSHQQSFYSEKLQEKQNLDVMEKLSVLETQGGGGGSKVCAKCGMNCKNKDVCPFRAYTEGDAKKRVKGIWEFFGKLSKNDMAKLIASGE